LLLNYIFKYCVFDDKNTKVSQIQIVIVLNIVITTPFFSFLAIVRDKGVVFYLLSCNMLLYQYKTVTI
jgi:hypothetical protein